MRFLLFVVFLLFSSAVFASDCPGEQMSTGWCYPTGTDDTGEYLGWHGIGDFSGRHLAQDIKGSENDSVYAIADGRVMIARNDVSNYGGSRDCTLGDPNGTQVPGGGMIIRHVTGDGREFDALYAHLKEMEFSAGTYVKKGQRIGKLRNYTWCGARQDHLHFGIAYPKRADNTYKGSGSSDMWAGYGETDRGFVCPTFVDQNCSGPLLQQYSVGRMYKVVCSSNYCWEPVAGSDRCTDAVDHWKGDPNAGAPGVSAAEACGLVTQQCDDPKNVTSLPASPTLAERFWYWLTKALGNTRDESSQASPQTICAKSLIHTVAWLDGVNAVIANDDLVLFSTGVIFSPAISLPDSTPELPNLRVWSVGLFDGDRELNEGQSLLETGHVYDIHVYPIAEESDAVNGVDGDTENIETDVSYKLALDKSEGDWKFHCRLYTRPSTLTKDDPHKESCSITVTEEMAGKRLYLKAKADSTGEVKEADEGDNWSDEDKEWYPIRGGCNLTISSIGLDDGKTFLNEGESYGLRAAVRNIGTTPCPGETRMTYYEKRPGSSNFIAVADDGSDANQVLPGVDQWEHTMNQPFRANVVGITEVMACADTNGANPETDETDNCLTGSYEVRIYRPDFYVPDLYLKVGSSFIRNGGIVKKDSYVHPYCTVKNVGNAPSPTSILLGYWINWDRFRDNDTVEASELCVGCEKTEAVVSDSIRLGDTGARTYRCCVDYQGAVSELNEANNCALMNFTVVK